MVQYNNSISTCEMRPPARILISYSQSHAHCYIGSCRRAFYGAHCSLIAANMPSVSLGVLYNGSRPEWRARRSYPQVGSAISGVPSTGKEVSLTVRYEIKVTCRAVCYRLPCYRYELPRGTVTELRALARLPVDYLSCDAFKMRTGDETPTRPLGAKELKLDIGIQSFIIRSV